MIILGNHYTHSLSKEINIFVDFFIRLSRNNKKIDTSVILFTEFRELAREANLMIEEKNKLEKELIESKENYSKLIDQAADAIIKADFDGNFIQVNPSFCLLTGFSEAQILKMNIKDLYTSEDLIKNPLKLNELNIGQEVINERSILTEQGHRIIVEINSKKIDKYTFLSIIRDISLRKKAEMELEEYRNYLENLVKERTVEIESKNKELTEKNEELERFNQLFVGREFRIKELRDKVKVLESQMKI